MESQTRSRTVAGIKNGGWHEEMVKACLEMVVGGMVDGMVDGIKPMS
jgi:hypothetical protein